MSFERLYCSTRVKNIICISDTSIPFKIHEGAALDWVFRIQLLKATGEVRAPCLTPRQTGITKRVMVPSGSLITTARWLYISYEVRVADVSTPRLYSSRRICVWIRVSKVRLTSWLLRTSESPDLSTSISIDDSAVSAWEHPRPFWKPNWYGGM